MVAPRRINCGTIEVLTIRRRIARDRGRGCNHSRRVKGCVASRKLARRIETELDVGRVSLRGLLVIQEKEHTSSRITFNWSCISVHLQKIEDSKRRRRRVSTSLARFHRHYAFSVILFYNDFSFALERAAIHSFSAVVRRTLFPCGNSY